MLALLLVLLGCKDDDPETDEPGATWSVAFDAAGRGAQSGVWGSGPDDVYVVGGTETEGSVMRWNGDEWAPMTLPADVPLLVWVYGFSTTDVWAVGLDGVVVHNEGAGWEVVESGVTEDLWGVWGASSDDFWIVGGTAGSGDPILLHVEAGVFTPVPLDPAQNDRGANAMFKVWGMDGRTFAVGEGGLIVEWDGTAWNQMSTGASADQDFVSLWGTPADGIVAVGGRSSARVAELSGDSWNTVAPSGNPGLNAVSVRDGEVLVGGQFGFVARWEGGELVREDPPVSTQHDLHAMWSDGQGRTYTVGGDFNAYEGTAWLREAP